MTDDLKLFLEMANDWTAVPVVRDAPERAADVVKQCTARLLAAEARAEQSERDRNDLAAWKESAMLSFRDWHAFGEALMEFAPLTIGDNIPQTLAADIPRLLRRS